MLAVERQRESYWESQPGLIVEALFGLYFVRWMWGFEIAVLAGLGLIAGYVIWLNRRSG